MSAANAERFLRISADIDITSLLSRVAVPTLIVHGSRDMAVPFAEAKVLAGGIKGSKLKVLDSSDHILLEDEPAWPVFLEELDAFIAGT